MSSIDLTKFTNLQNPYAEVSFEKHSIESMKNQFLKDDENASMKGIRKLSIDHSILSLVDRTLIQREE